MKSYAAQLHHNWTNSVTLQGQGTPGPMICEGYISVSQARRKVASGPKAWFFMTALAGPRTEVREAAWVREWPEGAFGLAQETAECSDRLWSPGQSLEGWSLGLSSYHFVWPSGTWDMDKPKQFVSFVSDSWNKKS